jgi:hypothetical protein
VPHSAAWPLVALLAVAAGSSAGSRGGLSLPPRILPAETFVVEPTQPIAGTCARLSGSSVDECAFLYRALLVGKLHRSAPGTAVWRRG